MKQIGLILIVLAGLIVPLACTSNNPTGPLATYNLTATFTNTFTPTTTNWAGYTSTTTPITSTPTNTGTVTQTYTTTATMTNTFNNTPTITNTPTVTKTSTATNTPTITNTPVPTIGFTATLGTGAPPNGLAYDGSATIYVAEGTEGSANGFIQMFVSGTPVATMTTYDGTHTFGQPNGVVCSVSGGVTYLYVVDQVNNAVYQINLAGPSLTASLTSWSTTGGGPTSFLDPEGIAVDGSGNIYVADTGNNYVEVFNSSLSTLSSNVHEFGGPGSGNGQFSNPSAIVVDGSDNIYVADASNQRIEIFNSSFTYSSQSFPTGTGSDIYGITLDSSDNIYVADTGKGQVVEYSPTGVLLTAGLGISPANNPSPDGLVFITPSSLVVTDYSNNQLYIVSP